METIDYKLDFMKKNKYFCSPKVIVTQMKRQQFG